MPIDNDAHATDVWMGSGDIAVGGRLAESGPGVYVAALEFSVLSDAQPIGSVPGASRPPGARLVFTDPAALDVVVKTLLALREFWLAAEASE
jgi:hypothetical protein